QAQRARLGRTSIGRLIEGFHRARRRAGRGPRQRAVDVLQDDACLIVVLADIDVRRLAVSTLAEAIALLRDHQRMTRSDDGTLEEFASTRISQVTAIECGRGIGWAARDDGVVVAVEQI